MIRQRIYLDKYDWLVYAYYSVGHYYTQEIISRLVRIGCNGKNLARAYANLSAGELDTGLTYSSGEKRTSVMVISNTSSAEEFFNSLLHEMRHLEEHICEASGIEPYGEPVAYLVGDLAREIYPTVGKLLCNCCRKEDVG